MQDRCPKCGGGKFWFDRTFLPPCDSMHYVCDECGQMMACPASECAANPDPPSSATCQWTQGHIVDGWQLGDGWRVGCVDKYWFDHGRDGMIYCPHCGRKIEEVRDAG